MLIQENPTLQTAAETLYRLNTDERFRETCERFVEAENFQNGLKRALAEKDAALAESKTELTDTKAELTDTRAELSNAMAELSGARETIAQKDAELLKAKEMIEKLKKEAKGANQ